MKSIVAGLKLLRPHQWVKNSFVLTGILFGHRWNDPDKVVQTLLVVIGFSLVSSAVYALNDVRDAEQDRQHPRKKLRPVASGQIRPSTAMAIAAALLALGFSIATYASWLAAALIGVYMTLNLAYSFGLKHIVILDVFIIAAGFMLRILAGTIGIDIHPSHWLLFCGLTMTLFLGFAKRRAELLQHSSGGGTRRVLEHYNAQILDIMIAVTVACVIISYSLYAMNERTIEIHGTENLIYTAPFVIYAIFRYVYLIYKEGGGEDTARDLVRDPHILVSVLLWGAAILWLIL